MSASKTKARSTKVGIALSAEAVKRLKRLASWMEKEMKSPQNPKVKLSQLGGIVTLQDQNCTHMSPLGALVQMYEPFTLAEADWVMPSMFKAPSYEMIKRTQRILGIQLDEYLLLIRYMYRDSYKLSDVITALRKIQ